MGFKLLIDAAKLQSLAISTERAQDVIESGMAKEAQDSVSNIERSAKLGALRKLPRRGGLAGRVAASSFNRARARDSLEMTVNSPYDLQGMDEGRVIHPTFGHRPWVTQKVEGGWFSDSLEGSEKDFVDSVNDVVARAINRIR